MLLWSARPPTPRLSSGAAGLRRGQSWSVLPWAPCQAHPTHGCCNARFLSPGGMQPLLPQLQPHSHTTTSTSGPCSCRDRGHRLSHRAPHSPHRAGHPRQCPAQLGAAGHECVCRFLQRCNSKRDSRAQARHHLTVRLSLNQSNVTPLQREGF